MIIRTAKSRFWAKVNIRASYECWEWTGGTTPHGYGRCSPKVGGGSAHRAAWELSNGPIPDGFSVLHHCDNRKCTNVRHLYLGTHDDNMRDRSQRNRTSRGARHGRSKLREDQIHCIRSLLGAGVACAGVARLFGVGPSAIGAIRDGKTWTHVISESITSATTPIVAVPTEG